MDRKTLLIGGTSHVGKSTLARQLASLLRAELISTDQLARHSLPYVEIDFSTDPKAVVQLCLSKVGWTPET